MTFPTDKLEELDSLRARVRELESEVRQDAFQGEWPPRDFYAAYHATTGFMLGMFGAAMSLLVNAIGAPIAGKSPLELIRIYLTFPLGETALRLAEGNQNVTAIPDGVMLAMGCCLYLGTGMLLGVPFFVILVRLTDDKTVGYRLLVATVMSLVLWVINFYGILSWLQPLLFGGRWITDPNILPVWVAVVTHLVFGWTLALLYPWGKFQPYQQPSTTETVHTR